MTTSDVRTYEFRIAGHLDDHWSAWFEDLTINRHRDGTCTLSGRVADQAQLHGILAKLRDIGATVLSLQTLGGECVPHARQPGDDDILTGGPSSPGRPDTPPACAPCTAAGRASVAGHQERHLLPGD
jgi:hypothetical protein